MSSGNLITISLRVFVEHSFVSSTIKRFQHPQSHLNLVAKRGKIPAQQEHQNSSRNDLARDEFVVAHPTSSAEARTAKHTFLAIGTALSRCPIGRGEPDQPDSPRHQRGTSDVLISLCLLHRMQECIDSNIKYFHAKYWTAVCCYCSTCYLCTIVVPKITHQLPLHFDIVCKWCRFSRVANISMICWLLGGILPPKNARCTPERL